MRGAAGRSNFRVTLGAMSLPPLPDSLRAAYDPEKFRRDGHRLVDLLTEHLARTARRDGPVLPWVEPGDSLRDWPDDFAEDGGDTIAILERATRGSIALHHPRYVGHQVPPPLPGAALADLVAAMLNNGMAVHEMGPTSTPMELAVIGWMARQLDLPDGAGGILTSGGSLGNLTALLAARQARAGFDAWSAGDHGGPPLALLCSAQAHYSVARAVRMMGWGDGGAEPVEIDDAYRMRPDQLAAAKARAEQRGRRVIAVVASAASTGTGAFDRLPAIADYCEAERLWLHVDGAHGASAALSPRHRHLVDGIARADSVVWDLHKLMAMPALITAVIYKDARHGYGAFAQEASYLYAGGAPEWWNLGLRTMECTKRMMSVIAYAALAGEGTRLFRDYVERTFALGAALAAKLDAAPDFALVVPPDGNIVCWRYTPDGGGDDALQAAVRQRVIERGRYYLLQTKLRGRTVMRAALMNPLTDDADLDGILDEIRAAAATL